MYTKVMKAATAALLVAGLAGCATGNTTAETTAEATTAPSASAEAEEVVTEGNYTVTNNTGETITDLYIYETGSEDKGTNYADGGLADGESVTIHTSADEEEADGYAQTIEYPTESGRTESQFQTLHLEDANLSLLAEDADTYTSATPFEFTY